MKIDEITIRTACKVNINERQSFHTIKICIFVSSNSTIYEKKNRIPDIGLCSYIYFLHTAKTLFHAL